MSIARQEGTIWFLCDRCSNTLDTEEADFGEAVAVMQGAGWTALRVGTPGDWEHICPEHRTSPHRMAA